MSLALEAPPALGTQDLHCHTDMSDGRLSLARVVEVAAERGVQVGIADHVSTRYDWMVSTREKLRRYLDAIDRAPVFRSAEFCWCDPLWRELPDEVMARFDYRIGSNHGFRMPDGTVMSAWEERLPDGWGEDRAQEWMGIVAANLCEMVRTMPIEIAAHSTLLPPALTRLERDPLAWWTEAREDGFVEALAEVGVALEISNRYRLPHDRLLVKARQAGVRFSLGSDGHAEHQVAALGWAADTARRVGVTEREMFVPERRD